MNLDKLLFWRQKKKSNDSPVSYQLSQHYKDKMDQIAREGEMQAEYFATIFRFYFMGFLLLFAVLARLGGRPPMEMYVQLTGISGLLFYNLILFFTLRKTSKYYGWFKYLSSFFEISLLTFLLAYLTVSQNNPTLVYTGAMTLIYFIFIALASIRNNRNVILFAIALSVIQYGALAMYFYPWMSEVNQRLAEGTAAISPGLAAEGQTFEIVSVTQMGTFLKLIYMTVAGSLVVYSITNSRRTANKQSSLIFNTEKQAILNEKKKSDYLLLNILPAEIADELKSSGKTVPRRFPDISVMFTDFKGFTQISELLSPEELVEELDTCFRYFDDVMDKYRLEKIKTIGDSYMCAGGLPRRNRTHAIDCVLAGLDIQNFMKELNTRKNAEGKLYWEIRLGIHTGNVMAGVVGKKKFAYDIWGDTVNLASRMESSGSPGMINISEHTYEAVKDFFICQYRGEIDAKNKGKIKMYYVHSILPHLSVDGKGIKPNDIFINRLAQINSQKQLEQEAGQVDDNQSLTAS